MLRWSLHGHYIWMDFHRFKELLRGKLELKFASCVIIAPVISWVEIWIISSFGQTEFSRSKSLDIIHSECHGIKLWVSISQLCTNFVALSVSQVLSNGNLEETFLIRVGNNSSNILWRSLFSCHTIMMYYNWNLEDAIQQYWVFTWSVQHAIV